MHVSDPVDCLVAPGGVNGTGRPIGRSLDNPTGAAAVRTLVQAEDTDPSELPPGNEVPAAEIPLVVLPAE